jgi:hypothetical protein
MKDKLELSLIEHERALKQARKELHNENLTQGEIIALHVEIEKLLFSIKTLNFIRK